MSFSRLEHGERPAIVEGSTRLSYAELAARADALAAVMKSSAEGKALGFVLSSNSTCSIVAYLAALRADHAVCLLDAKLDRGLLSRLIDAYAPRWIARPSDDEPLDGYESRDGLEIAQAPVEVEISARLALLLSTSGTTGSPKMVRLSRANLHANASAIAEYLALDSSERAITTLPLHYSYGLSVVNSHLHVGATLLVTDDSISSRPFWELFRAERATSFAGVPYTFHMLKRLRFERMELPSLRTMTQAGGRLDPDSIRHFHAIAQARGLRFFVMYGQTEATARMSYVPPERLAEKNGSVGVAIPGGSFEIDPSSSELVYRGENVMLGYAESRADLARDDDLGGVLRTGDLARKDDDGYVWLTGRMKRFVKLFGLRVNLDEVEALLVESLAAPVACIGTDELVTIAVEEERHVEAAREIVTRRYAIHPTAVRAVRIAELPRTSQGKLDYSSLASKLSP